MSKLLIVESPSKAKTISNYLGSEYKVLASYGHIRNLLPKSEGINTENFEMNFQLIDRNKKHIDAISKAVKSSDEILLATDPDREGEAIAWHIVEILNTKKLTKNKYVIVKHPKQGSGMISSISYSDGIVEIPEQVSLIKKGDTFDYYDFDKLFN